MWVMIENIKAIRSTRAYVYDSLDEAQKAMGGKADYHTKHGYIVVGEYADCTELAPTHFPEKVQIEINLYLVEDEE